MPRRVRTMFGFAMMALGALATVVAPVRATPGTAAQRQRPAVGAPARPRRTPVGEPSGELRAVVEPRVQRVVAEQLGVDAAELTPEVSLTDELAADSLDLLELALVLESEFPVTLAQRGMDGVRTYRDLVEVVLTSLDGSPRDGVTARALPFNARVTAVGARHARRERSGELTPYALELVRDDALGAGRGARLEVVLPAHADDTDLAVLRHELAALGRRGIQVTIARGREDDAPTPCSWSGPA